MTNTMKTTSEIKMLKNMLLFTSLILIGFGTVAIFYKNNILLTSILIIGWLVSLKFWHERTDLYTFFAGAIIVGVVGEILVVNFGAWQYSNPTLFGIPSWLPISWGLLFVLVRKFSRKLQK